MESVACDDDDVVAAVVSSSPLDQDEDDADENRDRCSRFVIVKPPPRPHTPTRRNDNAVAIVRE